MLGGPGFAVIAAYILTLLFLGWRGYRRSRSDSLSDFYLAGRELGFLILLATLYATQYSGNTFLGYTGQAYRIGFAWVMSVGMMMSVVVVYLLFAPRLHQLAHRHEFVTPADWVRFRYRDRTLALLVTAIMIVSLANYLYAQFLAMGHITVGLSRGALPFWAGVLTFAVVIGCYETLGGMRSVAWTDIVPGVMLFIGLMGVLGIVWGQVGSLGEITRQLLRSRPELVEVPSWSQCGNWLSSIVLLGLGAAVYPHAIQRIYAARDGRTLRRSLQVMICMPLVTTFVVFVIGIAAHAVLEERTGLATDRVMPAMLAAVLQTGPLAEWLTAIVLAGALAAMMSTADSALLSLSSLVARDLVGEWRGADLTEASLARIGKWVSWALLALLVLLALRPPTTLWRLIEIKMELLIQIAPLLILGIRSPHLSARTARWALVAGSALAVTAFALRTESIGGVHPGTYACLLNAIICGVGIVLNRRASARVRTSYRAS